MKNLARAEPRTGDRPRGDPARSRWDRSRSSSLQTREGIMRNEWILSSVTVGVVLSGLIAIGPAHAQSKSKQVDQITCEEFLALNPDDQQRIAYWVDGYAAAKNEAAIGTVAFDKFGQPIGALVDDCKATPKETLWQKLKKYL